MRLCYGKALLSMLLFIISKMQYNVLQYNNQKILNKNIKLCSIKLKIGSFFQGL